VWKALGWLLVAMWLHTIIDNGGSMGDEPTWCLKVLALGWVCKRLVRAIREDRVPIDWLMDLGARVGWGLATWLVRVAPLVLVRLIARWRYRDRAFAPELEASPAEEARWEIERKGAGAYLGTDENGEWVTAQRESAVMVLGPPRSGKTSAVMIPALLGAPGAVVSTSTKPDVMQTTLRARAELGEIWLFDPAGEEGKPPRGVRALHWSPVSAASTWDGALVMARAMTACTKVGKGTTNENHWSERGGVAGAPALCGPQDGQADRGRRALDTAPGHVRGPEDAGRRRAQQGRGGRADRDRAHGRTGALEHLQRERGSAGRV
jgi:hypothetical protein